MMVQKKGEDTIKKRETGRQNGTENVGGLSKRKGNKKKGTVSPEGEGGSSSERSLSQNQGGQVWGGTQKPGPWTKKMERRGDSGKKGRKKRPIIVSSTRTMRKKGGGGGWDPVGWGRGGRT